jgi:hypothetical protein
MRVNPLLPPAFVPAVGPSTAGPTEAVVSAALDHMGVYARPRLSSAGMSSGTGADSLETEEEGEWSLHVARSHDSTVAHLAAVASHVHRMASLEAVLRITKGHLALSQACLAEGGGCGGVACSPDTLSS